MPPLTTRIVPLERRHWERVRAIYEQGIAAGSATFETAVPGWSTWDERHRPDCRLVAENENGIVAWAALVPVSPRAVYAGVAEVSIYVGTEHQGKGVGRALLERLVADSESAGVWTLQAGIFPENEASISLHRALGFRDVGRRERIGRLAGRWRDVLLMERRSRTVGPDSRA